MWKCRKCNTDNWDSASVCHRCDPVAYSAEARTQWARRAPAVALASEQPNIIATTAVESRIDNTWWKRLFTVVEATVGVMTGIIMTEKGVHVFAMLFTVGLIVLGIHGVRLTVCYIVEGSEKKSPDAGLRRSKPELAAQPRSIDSSSDAWHYLIFGGSSWWERLFVVMQWIVGGLIGLAIILAATDKMNLERSFELLELIFRGGVAIVGILVLRVMVSYIVEGRNSALFRTSRTDI